MNNEKKKIPNGIEYNDKDYLNNLLVLLKCMEKNLAISLTEASNENLYKEYKNMFDEFSLLQRKAYELMFKYGWYKLEKAQKSKISTLLNNLENELNSLN